MQDASFYESIDVPRLMFRNASLVLFTGCLLLGTAGVSASGPQPEEPDPIVLAGEERILGHWQRGEGEAIIEITEREAVFRGVIVWSQRRPETVGVEVFRNMRYDPESREWHGRAYSIKRKREVRIDIEVPHPNQLELTAHILFFTRDVGFKRVSRAEIAALQVKRGL